MRVGIIAPGYPPAYLGGGPIRTVHALTRAAADNHEVLVLTSNRDLGQAARLPVPHDEWVPGESAEVYYASADRLPLFWSALWALRRRRPDVVYLNSYFSPRFSLLPRLLHRLRWWGDVPLVLAPRGELSPGALQFKSTKKRAFLLLARLTGLDRRVVWHVSSDLEAAELRQTVRRPGTVLVRANETELPLRAAAPLDVAGEHPRFVFLSRIVRKKGLDIALQALAGVRTPASLDVYGSEEDRSYAADCRALAEQLPPHVQVRFHGPVQADAVRRIFRTYDAFVLPTHGENFGHVIAEALSASCPVLTSSTTPWTEVLEGGGGVVVPHLSVEAWTEALESYARRLRADPRRPREAAQDAYERWRARQDGPTVFDLYLARHKHGTAEEPSQRATVRRRTR